MCEALDFCPAIPLPSDRLSSSLDTQLHLINKEAGFPLKNTIHIHIVSAVASVCNYCNDLRGILVMWNSFHLVPFQSSESIIQLDLLTQRFSNGGSQSVQSKKQHVFPESRLIF